MSKTVQGALPTYLTEELPLKSKFSVDFAPNFD